MAEAPRFFVFHGEDRFTQQETLADLKARLGDPSMVSLNTSRLDGQTVKLAELFHCCSSLPFLTDRRMVIVEGLIKRVSGTGRERERDQLLDYLPQLPPTTRLVFLEGKALSPNNRFVKLAADLPAGYAKLFRLPIGPALERWIGSRVEAQGGEIDPHASALLASNVGQDLHLLQMEITKLLSYTNLSRPIEVADVELLTPYSSRVDIFDLVDAIGLQRSQTAATLLRRSLEAGDEPLYLLAMIVRQIRLLVQVKEKIEQGCRTDDIGRRIRLHPYVARKLCHQAGNFALPQLEGILRQLLDTDVAIKTGKIDPAVALDLLVVELSC